MMNSKSFKGIGALLAASAFALLAGCATNGATPAAEATAPAAKHEVGITGAMMSMDVMHNGKKATIMRNQDQNANINPAFAKTSRKCPPFCIQPAILAPGVETIAEVEVLHYLKKMNEGDSSILVVDSRTPDWVEKGTIPGAINIPWTKLKDDADPFEVADVLTKQFGAVEKGTSFDFSNAKTLVMFCNGMWCGQSPTNIKKLLKMGYPAEKIKWYRGGMQSWETVGLTTAKP